MRLALILQQYQFTVRAIKGSDNIGADCLSRYANESLWICVLYCEYFGIYVFLCIMTICMFLLYMTKLSHYFVIMTLWSVFIVCELNIILWSKLKSSRGKRSNCDIVQTPSILFVILLYSAWTVIYISVWMGIYSSGVLWTQGPCPVYLSIKIADLLQSVAACTACWSIFSWPVLVKRDLVACHVTSWPTQPVCLVVIGQYRRYIMGLK